VHCCHRNVKIRSLFIVAGKYIVANNIKVCIVANGNVTIRYLFIVAGKYIVANNIKVCIVAIET